MKFTPSKINTFLLFKLPSAWFCGVRLKEISASICKVSVKHRWINQNPFNSMYFAVQAMAAELTTGALVMQAIKSSNENISMLVLKNESEFLKKAKGKITFECLEGAKIEKAIKETIATGEGQTCILQSIGKNEAGEVVSKFVFEWTIKKK